MSASDVWTWWLAGPFSLLFITVAFAIFKLIWEYYLKTKWEQYQKRKKRSLQTSYEFLEGSSVINQGSSNGKPIEATPLISKRRSVNSSARAMKALRPEKTFDLYFDELGLKLKKSNRKVLEGVTGAIDHGKTTIIMGPSGSGKTTFLTTLAGRADYGIEIGTILINGKVDNLKRYKKLIGFVPQDDIMHRTLTVRETLMFAACTRLPRKMDYEERLTIVDEVIEMLGLRDVEDSQIGDENVRGISGGQRKRVNIGIEMVSNPSVLFLDEPTSGLDSTASKEICACLQKLAELGLTIATVIHQPRYEIFQMFDNVLLLGKGGRTVYLGPTSDVLQYFEDLGFHCPQYVNPADVRKEVVKLIVQFFMDVLAGEVKNEKDPNFTTANLFDLWQKHSAQTNDASNHLIEKDQKRDEPDLPPSGPTSDIFKGFFMCFVMPFFLAMLFYGNGFTFEYQYGGIFGATAALGIMMAGVAAAILGSMITSYSGVIPSLTVGVMVLMLIAIVVFVAFTVRDFRRKKNPKRLGHFACGALMGPFFIVSVWKHEKLTPKLRYVSLWGFCAVWGFLGLILFFGNISSPSTAEFFLVGIFPISAGGYLIVLRHRYGRLPEVDRDTPSTLYQTWLVFKRSMTQQMRDYLSSIFDLGLVVLSAVFLGIIYFDDYYEAPLISQFVSGDFDCPTNITQEVCSFLELPQNDPLPGQATLTCMSLALSAVASSLRIFGNEKTVFRRESRSGLCTEAYCIGKQLAHLPTCFLAPLCFILCYYSLVLPRASIFEYFLLFFLVYFTCAGLAYVVSVLIPSSMSQLFGVLAILVFMMFSGANPTLEQLKHNELLPDVLYYPSYASLFRWTQETYYLIEISHYNTTEQSYEWLYGYHDSDWVDCWVAVGFMALVLRLATYVALVKKEE